MTGFAVHPIALDEHYMIHYHGSPFGGSRQDAARFYQGRHAMISFERPEDLGVCLDVCQSIALDNGAFSAWRSGKALDIPGYFDWLRNLGRHPAVDWALIPDVIDGDENDNADLVRLWLREPLPIQGVPVWHLHESLDYLQWLANDWHLIALGSSGAYADPGSQRWWQRMAEAMSRLCDGSGRPIRRLHGLRMLDPDIFQHLPLRSADSTNAVRNCNQIQRFGLYPAPTSAQRASVIADRVEAYQSAPHWSGYQAPSFCLAQSPGSEPTIAATAYVDRSDHAPVDGPLLGR